MHHLNLSSTSLTPYQVTGKSSPGGDSLQVEGILEEISKTMDQFEKNLEEMDITSSVMETSIQQGMGSLVQEDHVDGLLREVADEHGLELQQDLDDASVPAGRRQVEEDEDELQRRFNELKAQN